MQIQPKGPHHPSNCLLKGMYGRDCKNCDPNVLPNNKIRKGKQHA